jgi:hypothetical protein
VHREQRCFDGNADGVADDPATLPRQCYPWLPGVPGGEGHPTPRTTAEVYPDIEKIFKARIDWSEADEVEQELQSRIAKLKASAPFRTSHNADFSLARLAYAPCRLLKPEVVLETGVAYGVMSSFILKAMACNQLGQLISIDLPPLGKHSDSFVGFLIPERYKSRWQLHRGSSKRLLPRLLPQIGRVDFFIHDSLHTYWNIRRELFTVTPYLSRRSAVLLDDVDGNRAFSEMDSTYTSTVFNGL